MAYSSLFTFCPHCGAKLVAFTDDQVQRRRCAKCRFIQYRNPAVGVAVAIVEQGQLLLGLRRDGDWCIPCGYVEWDETIEAAAHRELNEETGLVVELRGILAVKSNFHDLERQTVGVWFRGKRIGGTLSSGSDLEDVAFFELENTPRLKFPTDVEVVQELRNEWRQ